MSTNDDAPNESSAAGDDVSGTTEAASETARDQPVEPDQPVKDAAPARAGGQATGGGAAKRRGRPIVGAIAGFLLGAFVWIDLVLFGVISFDSVSVWFFPILGLIVGIALAMWAPFGRRRPAT